MPWTAAEAKSHTKKANTPKKKRQWAHIANAALKGGASEGSAIRQASAAMDEQFWIGDEFNDKGWTEAAREAAAKSRSKHRPPPMHSTEFAQERMEAHKLIDPHQQYIKHSFGAGAEVELGSGGYDPGNVITSAVHYHGGTFHVTTNLRGNQATHSIDSKDYVMKDRKKIIERNRRGEEVKTYEEIDEDSIPNSKIKIDFQVIGDAVASNVSMVDVIEMDEAAKVRFTGDGFLTASPRIARTGIQVYKGIECDRNDLDTVKVYRPQDSVFASDAMHSYAHRPVTLDHPGEAVTADNWKKYAVGQTGDEVIRDGGSVRVPMVLMDSAAIQAFKDGKNQLSVGYTCDLDWTPGKTADGESYDAVQRNIKANHLAVVAAARGGPSLVIGDDDRKGDHIMTSVTKNVVIDGIQVEMTDTAAQVVQRALAHLQSVADQFEKKAKKAEEEKDESEDSMGKLQDSLKAKDAEIATLKQQLKDLEITPLKLDGLVKDRQAVIDKARAILGKSLIIDQRTVDDIRKQVVESKLGSQANGWDANQIRASFDTLTAGVKSDPIADYNATMARPHMAQVDPRDAAYAEYDRQQANAWRGGDQQTKQ